MPKGVTVTHRNIIRLIDNTNFIDIKKTDIILQTGSITFDASTFEIWGALLNGAELHLVSEDILLDSAALKKEIMIGVMQEITGVHLKMTGFEYLCLIAALNNYPPDMITERVLFIANKFNFESELHRSIKKYSAGTKKKIEFCAAIVHEPRVLLLDEPFESVDPIVCFEIKQHLKHLVEHGSTVIITSHILETIQNLCNKYIIINQGSVVRCGNIEKDNGVDLEQIFIEVVGHEAAE